VTAYYNEIDPYAAQWLRNLIAEGHIAPGDVDERSIADVRANNLRGYAQCHFFAGIGGWSIALRLAGWPDDRPVWTGSCPCQPFSSAGAGKAADDSRHLWPAWFPLIAECRPARIFGEQVEAAIGWGWLDAVFADLEQEGYACGAAVLPACSVGAPHTRQRLWFVADATGAGAIRDIGKQSGPRRTRGAEFERCGEDGDVALSPGPRRSAQPQRPAGTDGRPAQEPGRLRDAGELGDALGPRLQEQRGLGSLPSGESGTDAREVSERAGASVGGMADAGGILVPASSLEGRGCLVASKSSSEEHRGSFWTSCDWLPCTDGKARPVEPGSFPLAHGIQRRASKLRAYGNAIVPQTAAQFILAVSSRSPSQSHVTTATNSRSGRWPGPSTLAVASLISHLASRRGGPERLFDEQRAAVAGARVDHALVKEGLELVEEGLERVGAK